MRGGRRPRLLLAIDTPGERLTVGVADYVFPLRSGLRPHLAIHQPLQASPLCAHVAHCGVFGTHQGRDRQAHVSTMVHEMPLRAVRVVRCSARRESQGGENRSRSEVASKRRHCGWHADERIIFSNIVERQPNLLSIPATRTTAHFSAPTFNAVLSTSRNSFAISGPATN